MNLCFSITYFPFWEFTHYETDLDYIENDLPKLYKCLACCIGIKIWLFECDAQQLLFENVNIVNKKYLVKKLMRCLIYLKIGCFLE